MCNEWILHLYALLCVFSGVPRYAATSHEYFDALADVTRCPLNCRCDTDKYNPHELGVKCDQPVNWTRLPTIPKNTTYLSVTKAYMPVLRSDAHGNYDGKAMRKLILLKSKIASIDSDALTGLNALENLVLSQNKLVSIPTRIFANAPNILQLFLSDNKITTIPTANICLLKKLELLAMDKNRLTNVKFDMCFTQLRRLNQVDISNNPVRGILPQDFQSLKNSKIVSLYIGGLGLKSLTKDHFQYFPHLKILDLQHNKLASIPADIFQSVPKLTNLTMAAYKFSTIPSEVLIRLKNLQSLDIERNLITKLILPPGFRKLTSLTNLKLGFNNVGTLLNVSFAPLENLTKLTDICLENCKLKVIEANAFSTLHSLKVLKLTQNNINASVLERAFYGLRKATKFSELYLEGANLTDHSETTFRFLANTSLTRLSIKATRIQILRSRTFKDLSKLQYLYLKGNALKGIQESAFQNLNALIELDLSDNKLVDVPNAIDVKLGCLKNLILTRNSIGIQLQQQYFQGYNELETLNLNGNNIRMLNPSTFTYLPNLKTLLLPSNQIKNIYQDAFAGLKKLEVLDLQQNNIVTFGIDMFDKLPALQDLDLSSNNYITTQHENDFSDLFKSLRNLTRLQMREINLKQLPEYAFYNLKKLSLLSLSGNVISKLQSNLSEISKI